jgi:hypothetical protein
MELHQERELRRLIGNFFDKAYFYTVSAYEHQAALDNPGRAMKAAA